MKNIEFKINTPKKLIIGDPMYLDAIENGSDKGCEKKITFIRKCMPNNLDWTCLAKEVEDSFDFEGERITYTTIIVQLIGIAEHMTIEDKQKLIQTFKNDMYHPKLVKTKGQLGCDTAEFIIETNKSYDEFHTGADGYYGSYMIYKDNMVYKIELSFDADLFDFDDVVKRIKALF